MNPNRLQYEGLRHFEGWQQWEIRMEINTGAFCLFKGWLCPTAAGIVRVDWDVQRQTVCLSYWISVDTLNVLWQSIRHPHRGSKSKNVFKFDFGKYMKNERELLIATGRVSPQKGRVVQRVYVVVLIIAVCGPCLLEIHGVVRSWVTVGQGDRPALRNKLIVKTTLINSKLKDTVKYEHFLIYKF